jgi:ArsR family transcriptional regulator, arsenate/arsenite/antimonite-responsive transcriptional repressor
VIYERNRIYSDMASEEIVFKLKADFLKALAHPLRLALIELLKNGELSVGQLGNKLGVAQSNISKNLAVLKQVGIVSPRQEGVTVYYAVRDQQIFKVLRLAADILSKKLKESQKVLAHLAKR